MKKTMMTLLLLTMVSVGAYAQFEKGKKYVGASLTSAGMSYSDFDEFQLGADLTAGYMIRQDWMVLGEAGFDIRRGDMQTL